jgi:hypothetical protein
MALVLLSLVTFFVFLSVYLFYRSETINRELVRAKRDLVYGQQEKKHLVDLVAKNAKAHEQFLTIRLQSVLSRADKEMMNQLIALEPLVKNYSLIFHEGMRKETQIKPMIKTLLDQVSNHAFSDLESCIVKQEPSTRRLWKQQTLSAYVALVESLLLYCEGQVQANIVKPLDRAS